VTSVAIREARPQDEAALEALWCAAWERLRPDIDFRTRWPTLLEGWKRELGSGGRLLVAESPERICGFAALNVGSGALDQIAVAPEAQGSSVARRLLAEAKALSPGRLRLSVNVFNARAIRFYEREGFVRVGSGRNPLSGLAVWHYEWNRAGANESLSSGR
jgi:putative acetyltransferase